MIGGSALNAKTNPAGPSTRAREPKTKSAPLSDAAMSALIPLPTTWNTSWTYREWMTPTARTIWSATPHSSVLRLTDWRLFEKHAARPRKQRMPAPAWNR